MGFRVQGLLVPCWGYTTYIKNDQLLILIGFYYNKNIKFYPTRTQRHEEVQPREGHQVYGDLAQVAVQLPGEAQATRDAAHGRRHQVVQVTVGRCRELQSSEADVVEGLQGKHDLPGHLSKTVHRLQPQHVK